jgi:hypothetical protein
MAELEPADPGQDRPDFFTALGAAVLLSLAAFATGICVIAVGRVISLGNDAFLWVYALPLVPVIVVMFNAVRETYGSPRHSRQPILIAGFVMLAAIAEVLGRQMSAAAEGREPPSTGWIVFRLAMAVVLSAFVWWLWKRGV